MEPVNCLTSDSQKRTVKVQMTINKTSRMKCANTSYSSNPTLNQAVNGLHHIIQKCRTSVLHGNGGPTDFVGMGRLHSHRVEVC